MTKPIKREKCKAHKSVVKKAKGARGAEAKSSDFFAEIEKLRQMEDDIVAKYLENAPEYIVEPLNGKRVKVDKAVLEQAIREKIENTIKLRILMHDLNCTDPNDMSPSPLRDRAMYFKNTEEGRASLVEAIKSQKKGGASCARQ